MKIPEHNLYMIVKFNVTITPSLRRAIWWYYNDQGNVKDCRLADKKLINRFYEEYGHTMEDDVEFKYSTAIALLNNPEES